MQARLAFPFSGGAVTRSNTVPFGKSWLAGRFAFGWTRTRRVEAEGVGVLMGTRGRYLLSPKDGWELGGGNGHGAEEGGELEGVEGTVADHAGPYGAALLV